MMPVVKSASPTSRNWWPAVAWFGVLLLVCYGPVLFGLVRQWDKDPDMGHGFFVPVMAGLIAWQKRKELLALTPSPNWWGLVIVAYAGVQLIIGSLGAEIFLTRTAFLFSLIGSILLLGGVQYLRVLVFPLFLLFFMVPLPLFLYTRITFPLQILASRIADVALTLLQIPVLREGNILELPTQRLSVVEACSGIRSLLSLSFLALVYGYFFENRNWVRVALFVATVPIAIIANASRVTLTGILTEFAPDLAEGFFHSAEGWVIFMVSLVSLILLHQALAGVRRWVAREKRHAT